MLHEYESARLVFIFYEDREGRSGRCYVERVKPELTKRGVKEKEFRDGRLSAYASGAPVEVGDWVTTGTQIGRSGGGSGDMCRGNSTGSHLHFQLDKEDGSAEPRFPAGGALNQRDTDFQVTASRG